MRRRSAHTRRRLLAGCVATVALGALGGAGAVLGSTPGTQSPSPDQAPALPAAEAQAAAPLSGYQPSSGPLLADERIAQIARVQAAGAGQEDASMTAVDTTLARAVEAREGNRILASSPAMAALEQSQVVLVVLHGRFKLRDASVPRGHAAPRGDVLTLAIDARTGWVDMRELSDAPAPGIAALGTARALP